MLMDTIHIGILQHRRFAAHSSRRYTLENTLWTRLNEFLKLQEIGSAQTGDLEQKNVDEFPGEGVCERIRLPDPNQCQR
jgi:hypothetical protein